MPRMLIWFEIPFSSGSHFIRTLHRDLSILGGLHGIVHSFIELHKAVIHVIILVSFCDCGFHSVSPLVDEDKEFVQAS